MPAIKTLYEPRVAAARMLSLCASGAARSHTNFLTNAVRSSEFLIRKAAPLRRTSWRKRVQVVPQSLHRNTTAVLVRRTRVRLWPSDEQGRSEERRVGKECRSR